MFVLDKHAVAGSRVVGAVLKAMVLAVCLNLGWQFTGRDTAPYVIDPETGVKTALQGAEASYITYENCGTKFQLNWQIAFGTINILLILNLCIHLNMRLRKIFWPALVSYMSLFLYGYLSQGLHGDHTLSAYVINVIILFFAGALSVVLELSTGTPSCISVIPVVLIMAPGSTAVRISLGDMQNSGGVVDATLALGIWDNLVLLCVTYAVGLFFVLELFKAPLKYKRALRAKVWSEVRRLTSASEFDYVNPEHTLGGSDSDDSTEPELAMI